MAEKFSKTDFLTSAEVAEKLNTDVQTVEKHMTAAFKRGTKFIIANVSRNLVYDAKWNHRKSLRLHPLGIDKFKEIISKGK